MIETIKVNINGQVYNYSKDITINEIYKEHQSKYKYPIILAKVNGRLKELSSKLKDEMVVMIENDNRSIFYIENTCTCPTIKSSGCNTYIDTIFSNKISINTATKKELMTLTGIGESKAIAIIKYREENGSFNDIEEIMNVKGIGKSIYEKIKNNITL